MSTRLLQTGLQRFAGDGVATVNWSSDSIRMMGMLLDGSVTAAGVKVITNVTNATPMVVTSASHGFSNNQILVQRGVLGNLAANGTFLIKNVTTNTYELWTLPFSTQASLQTTGSGAYTSGGVAVNLTLPGFISDVNGVRVGTDTAAFTSKTEVFGVLRMANVTFVAFPNGSTLYAALSYKDTGTPSTSPVIGFNDGKHLVRAAAAVLANATAIPVFPLEAGIVSGTVLQFTNGTAFTTSAIANAGDVLISLSGAQTTVLRAGDHADALNNVTPNFPLNGNGGDLTLVVDVGVNGYMAL